tara:strand:+ start:39 stop:464 length:426 start_codon:yes stop_codon:yes gene_type:complete
MKQYRKSRYWVNEDGEILAHYPAFVSTSSGTYKNRNGKFRLHHSKTKLPEKWNNIKTHVLPNGYVKCIFYLEPNVQTNVYVHRLVAEIYCSGYFEGAHVDHIDGNPGNNHYTNLQWCTQDYNNIKRDDSTFPLYSEWRKLQ